MTDKELLQKVINDSYNPPAREDEDWLYGNLSEKYASLVTQYLPLEDYVKVYRQFSPMRDSFEFTVYVRHNKYGAMRIEFGATSDEVEAWGDNANDILVHLARFYIKDYLPDFEEGRKKFYENDNLL